MKGIVFTEFLEMVQDKFGLETVDYIINSSELKSQGCYTAVGTYDFFEMQQLLVHLSEVTRIPINDLIYTYGLYFFNTLLSYHPEIFNFYTSAIKMVASIQNHIHIHVKKIYPDAELPTFLNITEKDNTLTLIYKSDRAMYMFAKALMEKTFEYYKENVEINFELINDNGTEVKFSIYSYEPAIQKN